MEKVGVKWFSAMNEYYLSKIRRTKYSLSTQVINEIGRKMIIWRGVREPNGENT